MKLLDVVKSEAELAAKVRALESSREAGKLFFRGQTTLHPSILSSRNRSKDTPPELMEAAWNAFASNQLGLPQPDAINGQVKAILQHYGLPTYFLDITPDYLVAAWFATHRFNSKPHVYVGGSCFRRFNHAWYEKTEGKGYIIVLYIPDVDQLICEEHLFDLAALPEQFVRPRRQNAWLLLDRPPIQPNPNDFVLGFIEIDPAFVSSHSQAHLFPEPENDPCYARLLEIPFVETPLGAATGDSTPDRLSREGLVASRALDPPEYRAKGDFPNRKWTDIWICEPTPMRFWQSWRFDLSTVHPPIKGDICDTTKITLSPTAQSTLEAESALLLEWPALGADGLFFTYAGLDNDKFCNYSPPYYGVWLQKHEDLVVETPVEATATELVVMSGHVYQFGDGRLRRQATAHGCRCPYPETHDLRIASALRLSAAVKRGLVLLVPHPRIPAMFVAFTGKDMDSMAPDLKSAHVIMNAIFTRISSHSRGANPHSQGGPANVS